MQWAIVIAAFLASAVEVVEAFTLVLVAGITSNWRSAMVGALAAVATLAVIIATLGVAFVTLIPLDVLRFVIGFLLLLFGPQMAQKCHSMLQRAQAPARRRGHILSPGGRGTRTRGTRQYRKRPCHTGDSVTWQRHAHEGNPSIPASIHSGCSSPTRGCCWKALKSPFLSFGGSGAGDIGTAALGAAA